MRGIIARWTLLGVSALTLSACAADSHASLPQFMRAQAAVPLPEPAPDVKQMVHDKLDSVFMTTSHPRQVRVSAPSRDVQGHGWTACVRAEVDSATGKPLGSQTYRITISDGTILDRRRVGAEDNCDSENYEPI
ncbi:MAG TPA: hypothetical protein VMM15_29995 [Bradyrhizobium sp.]|nr:hypothetical protein [Bradyrhizobium sp.]